MLKPINPTLITELASRPGVNRIAVENFLMTCHNNGDSHTAYENARADAKAYRWSSQTLEAIVDGISAASGSGTKA